MAQESYTKNHAQRMEYFLYLTLKINQINLNIKIQQLTQNAYLISSI